MNLAVNARDAMPDGGCFQISTVNYSQTSDCNSDNFTPPNGDYVQLIVSDNGRGMDEMTRSRAFEPFFTTKERGKGTGLGLAAVYGIVKQSGGFISLESHVGVGATFTIHFPRYSEAQNL